MGKGDPPGWNPDLVRDEDKAERARQHARAYRRRQRRKEKTATAAEKVIIDAKREARKQAARDRYAAKVALMPPKKRPPPKRKRRDPSAPKIIGRPRPKTSTRPAPHYIAITLKGWRNALTLMLIQAGHNKARDISALLGIDPTSVAQSICELKRLGAVPSQIGRTPTRSRT